MIIEVYVKPQNEYTEGHGAIGTRKWHLDRGDDLDAFLEIVSDSHWPGLRDAIPIQIQWYGMWENAQMFQRPGAPLIRETLGGVPEFNKYEITARYGLHRMTNCWPDGLTDVKPRHPVGTTLSLKTRGVGQYILVSPAGMQGVTNPDLMICHEDQEGMHPGVFGRVLLPVTEYHITCDRMTEEHVEQAQTYRKWDEYLGTVNAGDDGFGGSDMLGAPRGTLIFDGYQLVETYAAHTTNPLRYRLTICLKKRTILDTDPTSDNFGKHLVVDGRPVGWNHDYVNLHQDDKRWGWKFIAMLQDERCQPRYAEQDFQSIFATGGNRITCDDEVPEETETPLDCKELCINP